ncbi:MAG: HAMP domain-containing sensor histidine kinase [Chloroflexota bacterium]|nr:HAMP domain-containing sensor histidine kinase [Chloroflexota bacterium]
MFTSLRSRLWLTYALVIGVVLSILAVGLLVYVVRHPLADRQAIQRLDIVANLILRRIGDDESLVGRKNEFQNASENFSTRIIVLRRDRPPLIDTEENAPPLIWPKGEAPPPERGVVRDQEGNVWLYSSRPLPQDAILVVATPRQGGLLLLKSPQFREVLRDEFLPPFLQAGGVAFLLSLLFAFWIARWVANPLDQMVDATRDVAAGEYRPIPLKGPAEVKALTQAFNEMSARVKASQQSQKDFVANVSHELKTPLTSIQGFSQAILDGTVDTLESLGQAASIIHAESSRMYRLVVDLLDLARLDAGTADLNRESLNVEVLLRGVVDKFAPQAEKANVSLNLVVEPLPTCVGDADRLAQVFTNLVDNALKHTPPAGDVRVHAKLQKETITISVTDTGEGIPPEALPRVFERFYQVDKSRKNGEKPSTGLGLAIAQQIIQAHKGKIAVDSTLGEGSVFVVHLPTVLPDDTTVMKHKK